MICLIFLSCIPIRLVWIPVLLIIIIVIIIIIIIIIIIVIIIVMCMSGHFCNTLLFSNSSFSVLCSKYFEVMKLTATRYNETSVDKHLFLILNTEKLKFLNSIFLVIITIVCSNYPKTMIIVCTNNYCVSKSVYKLCF